MAQRRRHKAKKRAGAPLKSAAATLGAIGARGDAVVELEGVRIYVPYGAPGDEARIDYRGERGAIAELLHHSAQRAAPPCPLFGACGGCALQHLKQHDYRDLKRRFVVSALAREGFDADIVAPPVACEAASRRRARFAVRRHGGRVTLGFNERMSARIVDVARCFVLDPALNAAMERLRALAAAAPAGWRSFDLMVTLADNGLDVSFVDGDASEDILGADIAAFSDAARVAGVLRISIGDAPLITFAAPVVAFRGAPVAIPPAGFLQASREGEEALMALVVSGLGRARRIVDLFSGCGTFTLPLAANAAVDAFDSDANAIAALDAASRNPSLAHPVRAERRNLFERPLSAPELKPYDAAIFDPPRAGARAQAAHLAQSAISVVVGVSCNPASFARDAATLCAGGYVLKQVTPVDQFVYSPHVELVGVFMKG